MRVTTSLIVLLLGSTCLLTCQEKTAVACPSFDVPVNVVNPDGRLLRSLKAEQFTAAPYKHERPSILSVVEDSGPRRILLVLETGPLVPRKILAVESSVITDMLSEARPEDSIALLTAGGPKMQVQFGGPRDAILKAVSDLEIQPPGREQPGGVLDAILEGANWFQKPRPGDSIFLLTLGFDSEHKTDYRYVQEELTRRRRLRLFSIQFAPGVIGTAGGNTLTKSNGVTWVMSEVGNFTAVPPSVINNQNVTNMSWTTGGYSVEENILGDPQHDYKVTANDLDTIKTAASRMQSAIEQYYRLSLDRLPTELKLGLVPDIQKKVPNAVVLYPRQFSTCSGR